MDARRLELGMSWIQLAERAGISDVSLRNFRKGRGTPNALSKRRLETGLRWEPGSVDAILAGGDPTLSSTPSLDVVEAASPQELRQRIAELREEIRWLDVKHERNRPYIVAHLERRIAELQTQLDALNHG